MTLNLVQGMPSTEPIAEPPVLSLIVLTDFFPAARHALHYSAELGAHLGAQVVLLHVQETSVLNGELLADDPSTRDRELRTALQTLADEVSVPTHLELVPDLQIATAAKLARRYAPALFVLSNPEKSVGEEEVDRAVLDVLRSSEFPLLVVPETYHGPARLTHAMVAADGEPFSLSKPAAATQLLAKFQPRLTVVTVSSTADNQACATALHQVKASGLADAASHTTVEAFCDNYPVHGLLKAVAATQADLLILIARRRSFLSTMFHRSVTNRLLRSCPVPMLVLPASNIT